jgi:hypothetical protein
MNVLPVRYYLSGSKPVTTPDDYWLFQSQGRISDWRDEKEYRHRGDFRLDCLPPEAITVFCCTAREVDRLRWEFPYRVVPLFRDGP